MMTILRNSNVKVIPRKEFPEEVKWDMSSLYGLYNTNGIPCFVNETTKKASTYLNKVGNYLNGKTMVLPFKYREDAPSTIPLKWDTKDTMSVYYLPQDYVLVKGDGYELNLFPYHDGIMVQAIVVNEDKRGSGIGTMVMNKLYDLSEEMEIPLYLVPFPAGQNDASKIYQTVERLEKWYDGIGFGPADGHPTVWTNFE